MDNENEWERPTAYAVEQLRRAIDDFKLQLLLATRAILQDLACLTKPKRKGETMSIKLGDRVEHKVHGFAGIVTGRALYLAGCVRVAVTPENVDKDGAPPEAEWFDEDLVEYKAEAESGHSFAEPTKATGGPMQAPTCRIDPC